jgi:hypothetical protein
MRGWKGSSTRGQGGEGKRCSSSWPNIAKGHRLILVLLAVVILVVVSLVGFFLPFYIPDVHID